jgi:predicted anti-sigma-YlaC factor YlaD
VHTRTHARTHRQIPQRVVGMPLWLLASSICARMHACVLMMEVLWWMCMPCVVLMVCGVLVD